MCKADQPEGRLMRYVDRRTVQNIVDMDAYLEREYGSLSDAIEAQPAPPCDECDNNKHCAVNNLACKAFFAYTREPSGGMSFIGWATMERIPSTKIYEKVHK